MTGSVAEDGAFDRVRGVAFNPADASENRIHADDVARQYGFRGGLVPGVTVYAYLVEPALRAWGRAFLERGCAEIKLERPLYDGSGYEVVPTSDGGLAVDDEDGVRCAVGRAALPAAPGESPERRGDPPAPRRADRPDATRAVLERLRDRGLGSISYLWDGSGELARTARDERDMHPLVRPGGDALANPSLVLGLANWLLSGNVRLGPWIHVESRVAHLAAVPPGTRLHTEGAIVDLFERKGHEFVDLDVSVFAPDGRPVLSAWHRAIYRLRPA